jgi:hypothetical protein
LQNLYTGTGYRTEFSQISDTALFNPMFMFLKSNPVRYRASTYDSHLENVREDRVP